MENTVKRVLRNLEQESLREPLPHPSSARDSSWDLTGAFKEELLDVQQFGLKMSSMLASQFSTTSVNGHRSSAFGTLEDCVEGTLMPKTHFNLLAAEHGEDMALLVKSCCARDTTQQPNFTQVYQRLEELGPEMIRHTQRVHRQNKRLTSVSVRRSPADELLYEVFPKKVAEALKSGRLPDPEQYPCVSLFFCDIVGYTDICSMLDFQDILDMLHRLYSRFDALGEELDLFKVGTVGDGYISSSGLRHACPDSHAAVMAQFAFGCSAIAKEELICPRKPELGQVCVRMGINAGPVTGAVVGTMNRRYCLFGDTVNVASRMESTSMTGMIQCSAAFIRLLQQQWPQSVELAVAQGTRTIKGKGLMETFYLFPDEEQAKAYRTSLSVEQPHQSQLVVSKANSRNGGFVEKSGSSSAFTDTPFTGDH